VKLKGAVERKGVCIFRLVRVLSRRSRLEAEAEGGKQTGWSPHLRFRRVLVAGAWFTEVGPFSLILGLGGFKCAEIFADGSPVNRYFALYMVPPSSLGETPWSFVKNGC